jgi:cation:H+ antiporter
MDYFWLILGFVVLIIGGNFLVKGSVGIATKIQISKLVIGMTVVSFGTSSPELLVSMGAALDGGEKSFMSIGNVIGSNIANIALVLGITALIHPIKVKKESLIQDWPVMFLSTLLFVVFMRFFDAAEYKINRWEGCGLFILIIVFTVYMVLKSRKETKNIFENNENQEPVNPSIFSFWKNILLLAVGCLGLVFGSKWLLEAATNIASDAGVSPFVIGVTILAFGTSVPELAASSIAAYRKQTDIAIGNLIGSNIFNILCVVGLTGSFVAMPLKRNVLDFDAWWMLGLSFLVFPLMLFGKNINRWKGILLLLSYFTYLYFLLF